jgi:hypothetical protein
MTGRTATYRERVGSPPFHLPTVKHRTVQPPATLRHPPLRGHLANGPKCWDCFLNPMIMRINSRHIPAATIPPNQDHSATQRCFNGGHYIKSIHPEFLAPQLS